MKDYIIIGIFTLISISSFYWSVTYKDDEYQTMFRIMSFINGMGFGLGAISGYTGWF